MKEIEGTAMVAAKCRVDSVYGRAGRIDLEQVDVLCAVSLGGVVAESIRFGDGVGGFADLSQLQVLKCVSPASSVLGRRPWRLLRRGSLSPRHLESRLTCALCRL